MSRLAAPRPFRAEAIPASAEATPRLESVDALDLLTKLVDKSLVVYEEDAAGLGRYRLLETVRQYARERLDVSDEGTSVRARHHDFFLAFAEEAEPELRGAQQAAWLNRVEAEHDNLRAVLEGCHAHAGHTPDAAAARTRLRLSGALWWFWMIRGYGAEGRAHLENALAAPSAAATEPTSERARALLGAGGLAYQQGDYAAARTFWNQSLAVQRAQGDKRGIAAVLSNLGVVAREQGEYTEARSFYEESLALRREIGDRQGVAGSLNNLALLLSDQGEADAARTRYEEALSLMRELGDEYGLGMALNNLGKLAHEQGQTERARALVEESLALRRQTGDKRGLAMSLVSLGSISQDLGKPDTARALNAEALAISRDLGDRWLIAFSLDGLASVAVEQGDYASAGSLHRESLQLRREIGDRPGVAYSLHLLARLHALAGRIAPAVRLWAASQALSESLGAGPPLSPSAREEQALLIDKARAALGEASFAAAWAEGHALPWEQAVELAVLEKASQP